MSRVYHLGGGIENRRWNREKFHELTHLFQGDLRREVFDRNLVVVRSEKRPTWLEEGAAEYWANRLAGQRNTYVIYYYRNYEGWVKKLVKAVNSWGHDGQGVLARSTFGEYRRAGEPGGQALRGLTEFDDFFTYQVPRSELNTVLPAWNRLKDNLENQSINLEALAGLQDKYFNNPSNERKAALENLLRQIKALNQNIKDDFKLISRPLR